MTTTVSKHVICFDLDSAEKSSKHDEDEGNILKSFLNTKGVEVQVFSSKNRGLCGKFFLKKRLRKKLKLDKRDIHKLHFPLFKPTAINYIDEDGVIFESKPSVLDELLSFKPWLAN